MKLTREQYNAPEQRLVRIETMLALLCHHLGLNPRTGEHISKDLGRHASKRVDQDD